MVMDHTNVTDHGTITDQERKFNRIERSPTTISIPEDWEAEVSQNVIRCKAVSGSHSFQWADTEIRSIFLRKVSDKLLQPEGSGSESAVFGVLSFGMGGNQLGRITKDELYAALVRPTHGSSQ